MACAEILRKVENECLSLFTSLPEPATTCGWSDQCGPMRMDTIKIRMEMSAPIFIDLDASDPLMDSITNKSANGET